MIARLRRLGRRLAAIGGACLCLALAGCPYAPDECITDADCGGGLQCKLVAPGERYCGGLQGACPAGLVAENGTHECRQPCVPEVAAGQCGPSEYCSYETRVCRGNACETTDPGSCTEGYDCVAGSPESDSGTCEPRSCFDNGDCQVHLGFICDQGLCVVSCTNRLDPETACGPDRVCNLVSGSCEAGSCTSDLECAAIGDAVCEDG